MSSFMRVCGSLAETAPPPAALHGVITAKKQGNPLPSDMNVSQRSGTRTQQDAAVDDAEYPTQARQQTSLSTNAEQNVQESMDVDTEAPYFKLLLEKKERVLQGESASRMWCDVSGRVKLSQAKEDMLATQRPEDGFPFEGSWCYVDKGIPREATVRSFTTTELGFSDKMIHKGIITLEDCVKEGLPDDIHTQEIAVVDFWTFVTDTSDYKFMYACNQKGTLMLREDTLTADVWERRVPETLKDVVQDPAVKTTEYDNAWRNGWRPWISNTQSRPPCKVVSLNSWPESHEDLMLIVRILGRSDIVMVDCGRFEMMVYFLDHCGRQYCCIQGNRKDLESQRSQCEINKIAYVVNPTRNENYIEERDSKRDEWNMNPTFIVSGTSRILVVRDETQITSEETPPPWELQPDSLEECKDLEDVRPVEIYVYLKSWKSIKSSSGEFWGRGILMDSDKTTLPCYGFGENLCTNILSKGNFYFLYNAIMENKILQITPTTAVEPTSIQFDVGIGEATSESEHADVESNISEPGDEEGSD